MATTSKPDSFQDTYWNLLQTLAWVHRRDHDLVAACADQTPRGVHVAEVRPGLLVNVPNEPADLFTISMTAVGLGDPHVIMAAAKTQILQALSAGALTAWGRRNNDALPGEIPAVHYTQLKWTLDGRSFEPTDPEQVGNGWYGIQLRQADVVGRWPDPQEASVAPESPVPAGAVRVGNATNAAQRAANDRRSLIVTAARELIAGGVSPRAIGWGAFETRLLAQLNVPSDARGYSHDTIERIVSPLLPAVI